MPSSRREFLKFAAVLSSAAGSAGLIPEAIRRAVAIEPESGSTYADAEHIVILMQENRSFDHALGTLRGVRGFNDPRALRQANGNSVFIQTDAAGNAYSPWRLDIKDTKITWMGSLPHTRQSQVDAWNQGQHNGWLEAKRSHDHQYAALPTTMGYYTRQDLPFYYALADAFTVCDQSYCGAMTSTTPNRSLFWTGTVRDRQSAGSNVYLRNGQYRAGEMGWKTFPERLEEAGISWKIYQNELSLVGGMTKEQNAWLSNFEDNPLEYFKAYNLESNPRSVAYLQQQLAATKESIQKQEQKLATATDAATAASLRTNIELDRRSIATLTAMLAKGGEERYRQLTDQQRRLHDLAFATNTTDADWMTLAPLEFEEAGKKQTMHVPHGDILHGFRKDVLEGRLPTVSWLVPPEKFSDHPTSPWYGAWYVSEVLNILTQNPDVWKKTIFILTYDENDGYFDHAPSYVAADPHRAETGGASHGIDTGLEHTSLEDDLRLGTAPREARSGPIGLGFRVPMIVASPWSRGGWVNSQLFEHTSTLMFLENFLAKKFGKPVREDNISAWRRVVAGDLTSCFRRYDQQEPKLNPLDRDEFVVSIEKARFKNLPTNFHQLSADEIATINRDGTAAKWMPHQEPGVRPSCALPYELYADGTFDAERKAFRLSLTAGSELFGACSAGAPFNVYLRNLKASAHDPRMRPATYAVQAGATLVVEFPLALFADGKVHLEVHAPNGFYRAFKLDASAPMKVRLSYQGGDAKLSLRNIATHVIEVQVRDNSYGAKPVSRTIPAGQQESLVLPLASSHGWYDVSVQVAGSNAIAHYAGRVETGRATFSDPLMGGVADGAEEDRKRG
ncbi:MAG: phospholipase C, phosphocholine-specific [Acidobacteriota bacterium]